MASSSREKGSAHLPSLDGIRGVALLIVLLAHLHRTRNLGPIPGLDWFGEVGVLGVRTFFVLSGFLISLILTREYERTGRISLWDFFVRRARRILPVTYLYLAVLAIASGLGFVRLAHHDWLYAAAFLINMKVDRSWLVGHLWSLAIEVQFYTLWGLAMWKLGPKRRVWVAFAMLAFAPVAHLLVWFYLRHTPYYDVEFFPLFADSLAAGCVLAHFQTDLENRSWYLRFFHPAASILLVVAILLTKRLLIYSAVSIFGGTAISLAIAILIHRSMFCSRDAMGRILNSRVLSFLGISGYSFYVWQQPFLNRESDAWTSAFPQNVAFAFATALLSYFLVEKRLMKRRKDSSKGSMGQRVKTKMARH